MTTELNIKETDLVSDVREVSEEIKVEKGNKSNSGIMFFGNLDIPMKEIDAAIKKLEELSLKRHVYLEQEI